MNARIKELERLVLAARVDLATAERLAQEYIRGLQLARQILAQREQQLADAKQLEIDEARP